MTLPYDPASQVTNILHQIVASATQINQAEYLYNPVGNRTSLTDRRGNQAFGYDTLDRLTSASHPLLATPQAFAYDAVGNRTTGGSVVNAGNQLTADATHSYQYDDNGNLTRKTVLATGNFTQYTYDAENRLTKVEDFVAGNPTPAFTSTYRYDGLGRRIEKVANGQTTRYVYDGEDILLEYDGTNTLQARYTHGPGIDEPLARTLMTPPLAAGQTAVLASTADGTGGLVVDDRIVVDGQHFAGFVLDATKPLPTAGAPIDSTGSNLPVPPIDVSAFVTDGQLTVEFVDFGGIRGSRDVYLVVRDSGTNQVVRSQLVFGAIPTFYSTHPSGTAVVYATTTTTTQVAGATLFYHQDGLGTVTDLTDSTGATAKSYSYDAYGNIVDQTGTVEQPYTYTGREFDAESGLYYYRARYYDPQIGRFLSQDPIGFFGGINLYQYVEGNPARFNDPTGLLENFTFELNNTPMSNLTCECGRSFPAFSGDADATNDPGATSIPDFGPIPKGSYYIVDRPSGGRLGRLREFISGSDKWYALYRDDGVIDDNSSVDGVTRGQYRLHSGTRSAGCITLQNADDFKKLRDLLSKTKKGKIPGTNIDYYGRVTVR